MYLCFRFAVYLEVLAADGFKWSAYIFNTCLCSMDTPFAFSFKCLHNVSPAAFTSLWGIGEIRGGDGTKQHPLLHANEILLLQLRYLLGIKR